MNRRINIPCAVLGSFVYLAAILSAGAADNTFLGGVEIITDGEPVTITGNNVAHTSDRSLIHVLNEDAYQFGFRTTCYWTGTTAAPYNNNDCILGDVYNTVSSNGLNRSWALSAANAYNHIPVGVTDYGSRVGAIGWAVSVNHNGHVHSGTLAEQIGLSGVAGFQGTGSYVSPSSARITRAIGVQGLILNQSPGTIITDARAGEFLSDAVAGTVKNSIAVYATASGGQDINFAYYGSAGNLYNRDAAHFGSLLRQSNAAISSRVDGNSIEFGHRDTAGYASTIGATYSAGWPFIAFSAEADVTGDTFRTRGKRGSVIRGDLDGGIIFGQLASANASGQAITESARFNIRGNLVLSQNPPASSSSAGQAGEIAWDGTYVYVCVAPNTWKRIALSSW